MAVIVQKFGGTSMGTLERIRHVAAKIKQAKNEGNDIVVVVSAMHGETDRLIHLARTLSKHPNPREYDVLVATGEQASMALLAIALHAMNCPARSYTSLQLPILTDNVHTKARIHEIETTKIKQDLKNGFIVIVAGFQGMNPQGEITTLGRGGSDTTAVGIAASLNASECQIYTDVEGVYTTDPRVIPNASRLDFIGYEEMLEMASLGAKVLQMRSVELASRHNVPLRVLSTFASGAGTLVTAEEKIMKKHLVSGIAFSREEAIISISGIPNRPGIEGHILTQISHAHIDIDMIAQNATSGESTDFTFTVQRRDHEEALKIIENLARALRAAIVRSRTNVAKLSVIGIGMRSHAGVASTLFNALGDAGINIQMITTSEIKISVILDENMLDMGIRAVHDAFQLDTLGNNSGNLLNTALESRDP